MLALIKWPDLQIQGTVLDSLKDCCALERISFEGGSFNIQGQVQNLKSLPKLKILELSRCSLSEECVRQLMELTNLTGLGFYEAAVVSICSPILFHSPESEI